MRYLTVDYIVCISLALRDNSMPCFQTFICLFVLIKIIMSNWTSKICYMIWLNWEHNVHANCLSTTTSTDIADNLTSNLTLHSTVKSLVSDTTHSLKYLVPSILGTVILFVSLAIGIIVYIRKRKCSQKKITHRVPILRPKIYKGSNNEFIEIGYFSSNDGYLKSSNSKVYCPTVESVYEDVA